AVSQWPQFSIHRGKLLEILLRAVTVRLGVARLHYCTTFIVCRNSRHTRAAGFNSTGLNAGATSPLQN
ncbi:MAG: hypothetical protein ACU84Q_16560, partial [Gammaproteobacteria bacterium]